ncbi:hypothetical protein V8C86DRAFT_3140054 [Haematococcus lacustris]
MRPTMLHRQVAHRGCSVSQRCDTWVSAYAKPPCSSSLPLTRRTVLSGLSIAGVWHRSTNPAFAEQPAVDGTVSQPSTNASPAAPAAPPNPQPIPPTATAVPLDSNSLSDEAVKQLLADEEEKRKLRRRSKGRIRELTEIRAELAEKELILLEKEQELLERDQTLTVLKEELELERKLRALLTKEKEKAEEEAALAMGLCTGSAMLP